MKTFIVLAAISGLCGLILMWMERNKPKTKKRRQAAQNDDARQFFGAAWRVLLGLFLIALLLLMLSWLGIGVLDTIGQIFSK